MTRPQPRLTNASLVILFLILAILAVALLRMPILGAALLAVAFALGFLGSRMAWPKRFGRGQSLAEATLEAMADAVVRFDVDGRFQYVNPAASRLIGLTQHDAPKHTLDEVFKLVEQESRLPLIPVLYEEAKRGHVTDLGIDAILITGEKMEFRVEGQCAPILSGEGQPLGGILVMRDVTEIRELQRKEAWLAEHDPLTGTLNRKAFENRLARSVHSKRASEYPLSLIYLHINSFDNVRSDISRAAANELIVQAARITQTRIRDSDPIGRQGDGILSVLLPACPTEAAERIAQTVYENLASHRFQWGQHECTLEVSLGVVHIQPNWETLDHVIAAAQTACALSHTRRGIAVYRE